jgi:GTP-binding protein
MLPVIALVGRPNVGKSTLFNLLTRSRDAIVADLPGLTRDRRYGFGRVGPVPYIAVDTGGLAGEKQGLEGLMEHQTMLALDESDVVFFMVDARDGVTAGDEEIADLLRRRGANIRLIVNKAEGMEIASASAEFYGLGLGDPAVISSAHGDNVGALMDAALEPYPEASEQVDEANQVLRVAVIGRPNVGKSTLINRMIGEERLVAYDQPGTTRDSISVPFEHRGQSYELIDTAGIRRRRSVSEVVEKFSIIKALQAIDHAHVVIPVLDAHAGITDQDATLLGLATERGRAMVIAVNKWDGIDQDQRDAVRRQIDLRLPFVDFARMHFISALHGTGVGDLLGLVEQARAAAFRDLQTSSLTTVLEEAVVVHSPPLVRGRRIRLRYAHQGGKNPPLIVIHGNQTNRLPATYIRYLVNTFRKAFDLYGTPVRIELRTGKNPYAGKRNRLTPRQERKRKRLKSFVRKKKN